ncbi:cephalosporin-C deacetylase-like acetyl esterase [Mucilaginibacter gracilis]|uniref:Cephalosporin-C deacetylase-like acetyl esterase n=1 Tax=Mucilaginibacter gracilis TaxID=423350 RepID=A0A495J1J5_9SPHI|nr:acetylxylan esterase [Mucilaginibacter gracilis]RKR82198.1 cephalosporin-C deacetylase-like acetyl esterase [Mucilaginibacter gracilis]
MGLNNIILVRWVMVSFFRSAFLGVLFMVLLCNTTQLFAQAKTGGEIVIKDFPVSPNAIFGKDTVVSYNFNLKNTYKTRQQGQLSYLITTMHGKLIAKNAIPVNLDPLSSNIIRLDMPGQKTGFYKVNFMFNVNDYDDTVRRVFGVDINHIKSDNPRPLDFDAFWANTKNELAKVPGNFRMTERPDLSSGNDQIYLIEMQSLDNITVRGWLTLPKDRLPGEKLPAYVLLPGYGANLAPLRNVPHFASLTLNVRGQTNSRDVIAPTTKQFITYNIQDKNKYIYRGAIMDCVRLMDFIESRAEIDSKCIFLTGGSMGGYLAMVTASLDKRVSLISANNPTFSDWRTLAGSKQFPMVDIEGYAKQNSLRMETVFKTLDYFDLKNFASNIHCKSTFAMGLLDEFAPPPNEIVAYNKIDFEKLLFIYPNVGHDVDPSLWSFAGKWVYDNFDIYKKVLAQNPLNGETAVQGEDHQLKQADIAMQEEPFVKDAIFKANKKVSYTISLQNNYDTVQAGTVGYEIRTTDNRFVTKEAFPIRLGAKASKKVTLDMPGQNSGFYKVNFTINVTDYDDTIRRVFGVNPEQLKSNTPRPADFDTFWDNTKKELAAIEPNFRMIEQPDLEKDNTDVFLVEMQSLHNLTVRGYLTIRKDRRANQKFPLWILVPGYGITGLKPVFGSPDLAVLSLNVRGEGNSRDVLSPTRVGYLTTSIEDKNKYIYRGCIMDCIRAVDFACSRPEIDSKAIIIAGGSMGGYLSIAAASLDKRIKLCSANNPVYADYRSLSFTGWPMNDVKRYANEHSFDMDNILNNLDYFDLKNFSPRFKTKAMLGISLLDVLAPPQNEYAMINAMPNKNKLFIYPNLGHEVPPSLFSYFTAWITDNLGLF